MEIRLFEPTKTRPKYQIIGSRTKYKADKNNRSIRSTTNKHKISQKFDINLLKRVLHA